MKLDDVENHIRSLGARLFALQAGLNALFTTHPDPVAAAAALDRYAEGGLANMLQTHMTDQHIATYQQTVAQLRAKTQRR